jgi:xanthine dehydrogenase accessory factor
VGELLKRWHGALAEQSPAAVATVIEGPGTGSKMLVTAGDHVGTAGNEDLDRAIIEAARGLLEGGRTETIHLGPRGQRRMEDVTVFVQSFAPPPRMYVFGAIDFASAVARLGKFMGYRVTVCDARPVFATRDRFPTADEVVVAWPDEFLKTAEVDKRTVICVLTHDPKFDVPLLEVALRIPVAYVGAMGSRRTHEERLARLSEAGLTEEEIARLSSPIGLDLGARTPEETAVSIAAEIIAGRWGGTGERLAGIEGPIHRTAER